MVGAAHEELQQTRVRLEGMSGQFSMLQKQVFTLIQSVCCLSTGFTAHAAVWTADSVLKAPE